jgi:hypothetical protein
MAVEMYRMRIVTLVVKSQTVPFIRLDAYRSWEMTCH